MDIGERNMAIGNFLEEYKKEFHAGLWNLDELNLKEMEEVEHDSNC